MLTRLERRQFRQVTRGLCATDPAWARRHRARWRRRLDLATQAAVDVAAVVLVIVGALTQNLPLVFAGIMLASAGATSYVSSHHQPGQSVMK